ncbi:hypothetical protein C2G38_2190921 [Gigaspora rosea]|uniref:Uncharacterized protein n=1 Tax=Gigaspora rosea TaxID=44941 RepID=A0A397V2G6_9GLOM|nr:hypothetical protein C2G38_2190921 [Gigaspora rosea]
MNMQQKWHLMQLILTSNFEFDDMDNSDNKLEQFEKENIMQTIANIDQITYNKQ